MEINNHNGLIPELSITDFEKTKDFYIKVLGFSIVYQRIKEGFALLALENALLMIDQINKGRTWKTGELNYPLGRGVNFQIKVKMIDPIIANLRKNKIELFLNPEEKWYATATNQVGNRQFLVKDPDGYLLRFFEDLGTKDL